MIIQKTSFLVAQEFFAPFLWKGKHRAMTQQREGERGKIQSSIRDEGRSVFVMTGHATPFLDAQEFSAPIFGRIKAGRDTGGSGKT